MYYFPKTIFMKTTFLIFPFLFFLLIFQSNVYTQSLVDIDSMVSADTSKSLFENFVRQEALDLILTTDFKKLVKEKKFGLYQPAHLVYYNQDSVKVTLEACLLYTSPSPRDRQKSRMPSSA